MTSIRSKKKNSGNNEDYSVFLKHVQEEKQETSKFARTLLVIVLIIGAILTFFMFFVNDPQTIESIFGKNSYISQKLISFMNSRNAGRGGFSLPFLPRRQNILLLGVDANGSTTDPFTGARSDTIVVMTIDPKTHSVKAISVPRDSKVYLAGNNDVQKINAAHAIGGVDMTKRTVEETLGIKIDRYIVVSDQAVENLVNSLGGVPVYVEQNMSYDDNSGHLHVHLRKGNDILDGRNAVGYLRFRHDGLGDIGRTQRQQWFLKGLLEKVKSPQTFAKLPQILNIAQKYIKTDMSIYELSQVVSAARGFQDGNVQIATLPGGPNTHGYTSYWILNPEQVQDVVNRLIYREDAPVDPNIKLVGGIMYAGSKSAQAHQLKTQLEALGYKVNCIESERLPHSQFIAHDKDVTNSFYKYLRRHVNGIDKMQYVYDPLRNYCVNSDFTIILAN